MCAFKSLGRGYSIFAAIIVAIALTAATAASERYTPATPAPHSEAFSLRLDGQEMTVTVSELEEAGLYQIRTTSPWETGDLTFQGVLLREFLSAAGLGDSEKITIRAIDNYTQTIPREDWTKWPVMLATRQNGELLTRRMQGPVRLIYPITDHPELDTEIHKTRWVWLIDSIEPMKEGF